VCGKISLLLLLITKYFLILIIRFAGTDQDFQLCAWHS